MKNSKRLAEMVDSVNAIKNAYPLDIRQHTSGIKIKKDGTLQLTIELAAEDILENPEDARAYMQGKWKAVPVLLILDPDEVLPTEEKANEDGS